MLDLCSSLFCLVSDHWLAILLNCATYGQGCALIYVCMLAIKIHLHKQTIHWATLFIELRRLFLLSIPPGRQMRTQNSLLMSDCSNLELLIWSNISECWFAIERPTSTSTLTSAWKSNLVEVGWYKLYQINWSLDKNQNMFISSKSWFQGYNTFVNSFDIDTYLFSLLCFCVHVVAANALVCQRLKR